MTPWRFLGEEEVTVIFVRRILREYQVFRSLLILLLLMWQIRERDLKHLLFTTLDGQSVSLLSTLFNM